MSRRGWSAAAIGIVLTVGFAAPAEAAETTFDDTCADVYGHRAVGDLEKTTDPAAGNSVMSGQTVGVTLSWPTFAVAGERAHRVIECLSIDGGTPRLWAERRFTSSDGTVTLSTVVPEGLSSKSTVCGQSFLKTRGSFGPVSRWSEKTCFPAAKESSFQAFARSPSSKETSKPKPESRSTPTTRAPLFSAPPESPPKSTPSSPPSGDYQAPWPPWEKSPRVERLGAAGEHDHDDRRGEFQAPKGGGEPVRRSRSGCRPDPGAEPDAAADRRRCRRTAGRGGRRPVLGPDAAEDGEPHRGQPAG